ncbi:MAG TPA: hypothetical protein VG370_06285 [Chloroflexota bacterium]|jgi:hypothetical protein|nr:hypothetical protein [Chloroflexota bacterium]
MLFVRLTDTQPAEPRRVSRQPVGPVALWAQMELLCFTDPAPDPIKLPASA